MSRLEVLPFDASHLPDAARLLAERHRRHRLDEPLLPARFEDPAACEPEVAALLGTDDASGSVAVRDGRVVGYLLGAPKPSRTWGPNVWVEAAGHAVEEAEDVRDLYAAAATRWVDEGRTAHYALVPAHDDALVGAWFRLAFGHQHTHAVRPPLTERSPGRACRSAAPVRADIPALARLEVELPRHQAPGADVLLRRPGLLRGVARGVDRRLRRPRLHHLRRRARRPRDRLGRRLPAREVRQPRRPDPPGRRRASWGSRRCSPTTVATAPAAPWPRRCWPGPATRGSPASRPTGGPRTCCPPGRGRPWGSVRRTCGCTGCSATEAVPQSSR